jgi:hypothetical protein
MELIFFRTSMPDTRPADYCLGCLEGCIFMDFDNFENERVLLSRISFDGYGCCVLGDEAIPMNKIDSQLFKELIQAEPINQIKLNNVIKRTLTDNRKNIWEDALKEYRLT